MTQTVEIDVACNDPDNGLFAHRAEFIQLRGGDIELERYPSVRFSEMAGCIRIHRQKFQITQSKDWVGNWCWNRYTLPRSEAKRLVASLRKNGWKCTQGPLHYADWWNREGRFAESPLLPAPGGMN